MSSLPTLGYWNIRGLGEPIRYLLKYVHVEFVDKRYTIDKSNMFKQTKEWVDEKSILGLDFPNLPYYIEGNVKLTQTLAILRYLGRKHGLIATDEKSLVRQDMVEQQIIDIGLSIFPVILSENLRVEKQKYITETLPKLLELFSKFLDQNEWFVERLTYVDFIGYETIDKLRLFSPETVDKFPNLIQYLNRFESLPSIKAYRSSPEFKDWPLYNPMVKWGFYK